MNSPQYYQRALKYRKWLEERIKIDSPTPAILTDLESAVLILLEMGFTRGWIIEHFEFSRQRMFQILRSIRDKVGGNYV